MAFLRCVVQCSAPRNPRLLLGAGGASPPPPPRTLATTAPAPDPDGSSSSKVVANEPSATPPATTPPPPPAAVPRVAGRKDPLDLSFNNPVESFKSKTTWELVRALICYSLCSFEPLVEHNMKLMKAAKTILGDKMFKKLMQATFYGHFVAGEDQYKIRPTLERLHSFGVKAILDYSVEEDISQEEAEKRELESSVPETGDQVDKDSLAQFHVAKTFADRRYKVNSARTYFYINEAQCEKNMEMFIRCLEAVADFDIGMRTRTGRTDRSDGTALMAIKMTALGRPQLLLQLSEVIMRTRRYMAEVAGGDGNVLKHHMQRQELQKKFEERQILDNEPVKDFLKNVQSDEEGILHLFPWSGIIDENQELSTTFRVPDLNTGKMVRLITQLSRREEEMFRNMIRRMDTVIRTASELNVRVMVDAEQTYFQPAISRITLEFMRKYNQNKAIVFNTYQCYLRATFQEIITDLEQGKRQGFYFACKLVRGAYLEQERARAAALGYPDPTNPTFEATTEMYHKVLTECLRRVKQMKDKGEDPRKVGVMVASHNEDTVHFAIQKMKEIGILPEDKVICFGQLLGMCDYITFPLGQAGYSAYKYIPYGPVNEVLPYLSRRAQENKGVLKKIKKEKALLRSEILRRTRTGQLFYTPKGDYVPV